MDLATVFLTLLASSILAALVTYRMNESKDRRWFMGRKAEELYCAAEAIDREVSKYFGSKYAFGAVGRAKAGDDEFALMKIGTEFVNAKMLIGFYFPTLSPDLARPIAALTTAVGSLKEWEMADASGQEQQLHRLDADVASLKDALEAFKAAILRAGRTPKPRYGLPGLRRPAETSNGRVLRVA